MPDRVRRSQTEPPGVSHPPSQRFLEPMANPVEYFSQEKGQFEPNCPLLSSSWAKYSTGGPGGVKPPGAVRRTNGQRARP